MAKSDLNVLWGVDPFDRVKNSSKKVMNFLEEVDQFSDLTVDALYFMSAESLGIFPSMGPKEANVISESAQVAIDKMIAKNSQLHFRHGKIIKAPSARGKSDAERLASQALKNKSDFIIVASHGRSGAPRLFMGSFAESLLLSSKVPVVIVNPKSKVQKIKKILFATDLSSSSKKAFKKIYRFAQLSKAQVTVFHKLFDPAEAMAQTGVYMAGGGFVSLESNLKKERKKQSERIKTFSNELSNKGIRVKHKIVQHSGPVDDLICSYAKDHGYEMIAMATESGTVSSMIFGSIGRQVARAADVPTMLIPIR